MTRPTATRRGGRPRLGGRRTDDVLGAEAAGARPPRRSRAARIFGLAAAAAPCAAAAIWVSLPMPPGLLTDRPSTMILTDREGRPLRVRLPDDEQDCRWTPLSQMGPWIGPAIVAAEDRRFYRHPGIDPLAILRAAAQNLAPGRVVSGASTISTQVIRLVRPRPRTWWTKLSEAVLAIRMERTLTKEAILEHYLNRAPFGGNLVGAQAAARRYFGRDIRDLTLAEAALLAGLPQSPARLRPDRRLPQARARQALVLQRMVRAGFITEAQRREAAGQPIAARLEPYPLDAPHFCEAALRRRATNPGGPATVRTTLDPVIQRIAEDALRRRAAERRADGVHGGAVVVLEVASGAVRALVGSPDPGDARQAGHVNGASAPRSAGSTLKPFLYAMALDEGRVTPLTVLADVPSGFPDYDPANFDREFRGLVSVRSALIDSLNIPAIRLAADIGPSRLHRKLLDLGLRSLSRPASQYGAGLALGNGEVTLIELAVAYAALARGGLWRPAAWFEPAGDPASDANVRVFSAEAAWMVSDMLADTDRAIPEAGPASVVRLPPAAWKTGTSSGFRDAWTIAWNPAYVIAVWIGNPGGAASPALVGGQAAAPVAWDILRALYPRGEGPWFARPAGVVPREVCAVSGRAPTSCCRERTLDTAIAGVSRHILCPVHQVRRISGAETVAVVWPEDVAALLARRSGAPAAPSAEASAPRIVSPRPGASYRRWAPPGAPVQPVPLIEESPGTAVLWWFADGEALGSAPPGDPVWWAPPPGRHTLVCCDAAGRSARVRVTVE